MLRCRFGNGIIASAGYDAQCELLEITFVQGGQCLYYKEVPEEIWYHFRSETHPEEYFNRAIKGCYIELLEDNLSEVM